MPEESQNDKAETGVRLTGHDGNVEQPTLTFVDADTFTIKAVDKAKDIAVFRCRRVQDG